MKRWILCFALLLVILSGCSQTKADVPAAEKSAATDIQSAPSTETTVVPLHDDVPLMNLISNDHEILSLDFVKNYLTDLKNEQTDIQMSAYAGAALEKCPVTDTFLEILKLDEWKEVDPESHEETYLYQSHYQHRVKTDHEEMVYLCIGETYASLELKVMTPFCYENGTRGEMPQIQGIRIWELPQDEPGDIMSALAAYGESLPSW